MLCKLFNYIVVWNFGLCNNIGSGFVLEFLYVNVTTKMFCYLIVVVDGEASLFVFTHS